MQVWALIVDSFREALDRRIFWVMLGLSAVVAAAMACVGLDENGASFLFGAWEFTWQEMSRWTTDPHAAPAVVDLPPEALRDLRHAATVGIVVTLADLVVGWVGIILAIIATAGFFPSFLDGGAIDVVLSKPISRPVLFAAKYVGSMAFVLFQAAWFVGLTFLVTGLRWNMWLPGYLLTIPLMVLLFSYLYCITALVGVKTRSTVAAILITIGAWFVFFGIQAFADATEIFPALRDNRTISAVARGARWVVPKTSDITYLATRYSGGGSTAALVPPGETEEERDLIDRGAKLEDEKLKMNPWGSIGSSLAFEAILIGWAVFAFSRKDF